MIDWQEVAKQNGLTPKEFTKEILTVAAVVGAMEIDGSNSDALKFTVSDDVGDVQILISRLP